VLIVLEGTGGGACSALVGRKNETSLENLLAIHDQARLSNPFWGVTVRPPKPAGGADVDAWLLRVCRATVVAGVSVASGFDAGREDGPEMDDDVVLSG
jgi:hypothetical protein